jgi:hypothetical protein
MHRRLITESLQRIVDHHLPWPILVGDLVAFREHVCFNIDNHSDVDESITVDSRMSVAMIGEPCTVN